jgi:hypothetical protein
LNNYKFRRKWVAFLSEIVEYVELMYENEVTRKMDAINEEISKVTFNNAWWQSFDWSTVKGHIETAKEKLENEPTPTLYERYVLWDVKRNVLLDDVDGRRMEMTELLEQLQKLSVG